MLYDWRFHDPGYLEDRFPKTDNIQGGNEWSSFVHGPMTPPLPKIARRELKDCPCVFISHRRKDVKKAVDVAKEATRLGFDYWLDIHDPTVAAVNRSTNLTVPQKGLAVAMIIEMGLINSSHLVAVMTNNTKGSEWVPYEYGRVKDDALLSRHTAAWITTTPPIVPSYMHLGQTHMAWAALQAWLKGEMKSWKEDHLCMRGIDDFDEKKWSSDQVIAEESRKKLEDEWTEIDPE